MQSQAAGNDSVGATVRTDHSAAEINVDHDKTKRSFSDVVFAGIFVPVYATGCFVWWVAHGCPNP
jgi:hypothetical protein